MVSEAPARGDVVLVDLRPTRGRGIRKVRPCVVVSPDELNRGLATFNVAPLTTGAHPYPFRVAVHFDGRDGHVVLDQLRTIDGSRIRERLGPLPAPALSDCLRILGEMFAE